MSPDNHVGKYTSMEDLAADDDLLSDILLDHLEWEAPISTYKMNPQYRSPRFDTNEACEIVSKYCAEMEDIESAVERICEMPVVKKHVKGKTARQEAAFRAHVHRYLECYLPDSGIEFALTMRYKQSPAAPLRSRAHKAAIARLAAAAAAVNDPTSSPASLAQAKAVLAEDEDATHAAAAAAAASSTAGGEASTSNRTSSTAAPQVVLPPVTPPNVLPSSALLSKADLCILAVRPFRPGELIRCKGSITDLTKEEDEALREEAAHIRLAKRGRRKRRKGAAADTAAAAPAANEGAPPIEVQGAGEGSGEQKSAQEVTNGDASGEDDDDDDEAEEDDEEGNAVAAAAALAKKFKYKGVLGAGRDFSVIKSARKGCSQLFLGPARFINHDCEPNVEFHRMGHQMTFRVIRPIAINEEVTTYYGDNYFDVMNAECLCATCEARGTGAFTLAAKAEEEKRAASPRNGSNGKSYGEMLRTDSSSSNGAGDANRRPSSTRQAAVGAKEGISSAYSSPWGFTIPGTEEIKYDKGNSNTKDGNITRKLMDEPEALQESAGGGNKGPERECVTCGAHFWSRESWWKQEECGRCERHYKIFKADWPGREPTESLIARSKGKKPGEGIERPAKGKKGKAKQEDHEPDVERPRSLGKRADRQASSGFARRGRESSSRESSSVASSTASPVVLTPLRDHDTPSEEGQPPTNGTPKRKGRPPGKKKRKIPSDLDMTDEDAIDEALGIERRGKHRKPSTAKRKAKKARVEEDEDEEMSDSDLSSLTSESSDISDDEEEQVDEKEAVAVVGDETATRVTPRGESKEENDRERSASSQASSSASTSASGSTGPKMLGKEAKTETLALYWGAVDGERRSRRRSMNGPVALADSTRSERRVASMGHRRTGSLVSNASVSGLQRGETSKAVPVSPSRKKMRIVDDEEEESLGHVKKERQGRRSGSPEGSSASPFVNAASPKVPALATAPLATTTSESAAPTTSALATTGTERTSVKNLALAWGVPMAEGRTRRHATKDPGTASPQSGPSSLKRRRSLRGCSAESSRAASSTFEEDDPQKRAHGRSRQVQVQETRTPERESSQQRDDSPRVSLSRPTSRAKSSAPPEEKEMRRDSIHVKREDDSFEKMPVSIDGALPTLPSNVPVLPVHPSSAAPRVAPVNLSGSPTFPFANGAALLNQDAPLKQPTRKNLRWGKGKVSMSRPMPLLGSNPAFQAGGPSPPVLGGSPGPAFESESNSPRAQSTAAPLPSSTFLQSHILNEPEQLVSAAADTDKTMAASERTEVKEEPTSVGNVGEVRKEPIQYSQTDSPSVA